MKECLSEKQLVIICEDSYGLDIMTIIDAINTKAESNGFSQYHVIGFISDEKDPFTGLSIPVPLIGNIIGWKNQDDTFLVMGIRDPKRKEEAVKILKSKGAKFETLIAPWTLLPPVYEVGEGCIIANYNIKNNSKIGSFVIMDTVMCETVKVDDYSTICPFVNLTSAAIGKRVYVGSHTVIMSRLQVGDDSYIYPGSIVVKNVKPGSVLAGIPATGIMVKKWKDNKLDRRN